MFLRFRRRSSVADDARFALRQRRGAAEQANAPDARGAGLSCFSNGARVIGGVSCFRFAGG